MFRAVLLVLDRRDPARRERLHTVRCATPRQRHPLAVDTLHRNTITALLNARQVTIAAPGYGPDNTVWTVL
ncbi:MAG: hypothetical protein J2P17_01370 [Mycobacterium sp.]|nr:hypothetical protein [Mycobacterium sp.]